MVRWLVLAFAVLGLMAAPLVASAQTTPRINPLTGRPYSPQAQGEYERRLREDAEQDRIAQEAADQYEKDFAEIRARAADQVRQFDTEVEAWRASHTAPAGTTESFIVSRYSGETALPESATITYYNRWREPTHKVEFGPDGKPTGPVTQTQQGKAWETIGPRIPPGGGVASYYGKDFDGEEIIRFAEIYGPDGRTVATFDFNFEGVPWQGELFDPATGKRTGGFLDERLRSPEPTFGGPLAEPAPVRQVTGVCSQCRPLADEHNDLAARINRIVAEMKSLSAQHQRAWPSSQKPIEMRHATLAAELAQLTPQFEALRARVLECEKQCRAAEEKPREEPLTPRADDPAPQGPVDPALVDARFKPGGGAIPADNRDLQAVIDAAQAYLDAADCKGLECPVCDCDQAYAAFQALSDMEAYLKAMQPYMKAANESHFAQFKTVAENNIINGKQRDRTIRAIGLHQFYQNFGSMLLDVASIGSFIKETLEGDGLENMSPYEMLDKLDSWYEAAKDLESLANTGAESLTGEEQASPVADLVGGGEYKDMINDGTSYIADAKSVIVAALKNGKDWRAALKKDGAAAALGQFAGRIAKYYAGKKLQERQQALDELLRDAEAGDLMQANAYIELTRVQLRRQMLDDALAAVSAAKAAYQACLGAACPPRTMTRPVIPGFIEDVPGGTPKFSWGKALPWFNEAIARTLPKMKPVAFTEGDCPKEKEDPRTAGDQPPSTTPAAAGDAPPLSRPQFQRVPDLQLPTSFCSEEDRNRYIFEVYNPAVAAALDNARIAQGHQANLNTMFTEHMRANSPWWGQVRAERDAFEPIAAESITRAEALRRMYAAILAVPAVPCGDRPRVATGPTTPPVEEVPVIPGTPKTPATPTPGAKAEKEDCPPRQGRQPITVGPNNRVGSGAQLASKMKGMAAGALMGALGVGGGGGGGGSDGPDLWTCKIKESEYTVFEDPVTGVSLAVGAKPAKGGKMVVFSKITKSPDKGTFQTAFLERPSTGQTIAPSDVGPCDLWGEWKLTVSWTRSTYVDGQLVKQESGGWSEGGLFKVPGVLSRVDAPDGLWKRMGFSNASNGAREMGAIFDVQPGGEPLTLVIHVTRPKGDPVTTVPFILTLTQGPDGKITVTRAKDEPCPPGPTMVSTGGPSTTEGASFTTPTPPPPVPTFDPAPAPYTPLTDDDSGAGMPSTSEALTPRQEDVDRADDEERAVAGSLRIPTAQRAAELVDAWRKADDEAIRLIEGDGVCAPEQRARLLKELKWRLSLAGQATEPAIQAAAEGALKIDGDRIRQLIEILEDEETPCAPLPPPPPATTVPLPAGSSGMTTTSTPPDMGGVTMPPSPPSAGTTTRPPPPYDPGPRPYDPTEDPEAGKLHTAGLKLLVDGLEKMRAEDIEKRRELDRSRCEGPKAWEEKRAAYLKRLRGRLDIMTRLVGLGQDKAAIESAANGEVVRLGDEISEVEAMSPPADPQSCPVTPVPEEGESILDEIQEVLVPA